ncbi:hypothetical protein B0H16DRAFT_1586293 [Mycena metata]|uniref:Uncharacterized protein n=1 Tax=Mycena metata TaxID=1033252 RepID=A0AAD7MS98_9AGAR|nr:hypothetical protein B0H16DRAFT_1586293 [Mycena metata]
MSLRATPRFASQPQRLSDEILLTIFRETLLPSWMTDLILPPTLPPFRKDASCAELYTTRTITEVSKAWYNLGVGLLYEKITLRRLNQLSALLGALEAQESLRHLVRSFDITFLGPQYFFEYHDFEIRKIVELCPRLSHFGYFPPQNDSCHTIEGQLLPSTSSSAITSLGFSDIPGWLLQPALIQHCRNLRSLSLPLSPPMAPNTLMHMPISPDTRRRYKEEEARPLSFDNLQVLHLTLFSGSVIRDTWSMPRLQRVSLCGTMKDSMTGLLAPFGGTITSLSLYNLEFPDEPARPGQRPIRIPGPASVLILQGVLDSCPKLDHLALSVLIFDRALQQPTITAMDIFCLGWNAPEADVLLSLSTRFPALQTLRTLDESMRVLRDIPRSFPESTEFARIWEWASGHSDDASSDSEDSDWRTAVYCSSNLAEDGDEGDHDYSPGSDDDDDTSVKDASESGSDSDAMSCITVDDTDVFTEENLTELLEEEEKEEEDRCLMQHHYLLICP